MFQQLLMQRRPIILILLEGIFVLDILSSDLYDLRFPPTWIVMGAVFQNEVPETIRFRMNVHCRVVIVGEHPYQEL